jgi:hypothetical protein
MRQRFNRAQQSKKDHNLLPPVRERRRSAVLTCPTPSEVKITSEKFPPFETWPEIMEHNRMCVLPTVGAWYYPELGHTFSNAFGETPDPYILIDNYIRLYPFLEPYRAKLFPMISEIAHSKYGVVLPGTSSEAIHRNSYIVNESFYVVLNDLMDRQEQSVKMEWMEIITQSEGLINAFCTKHENMHLLSFRINRPVLKEFKEITVELFNLLCDQTNSDTQSGFWASFQELNNRLMNSLSIQFALEELRAK